LGSGKSRRTRRGEVTPFLVPSPPLISLPATLLSLPFFSLPLPSLEWVPDVLLPGNVFVSTSLLVSEE